MCIYFNPSIEFLWVIVCTNEVNLLSNVTVKRLSVWKFPQNLEGKIFSALCSRCCLNSSIQVEGNSLVFFLQEVVEYLVEVS